MVSMGSGGAFGGFYRDDSGALRSGADFILYHLPMAQGLQYIQNFWARERVEVVRAVGKVSGTNSIV